MRQGRLIIIALLMAGWANATCAQDADVEKLIARSDPAFQAQIQTIFNALHQPRVDARDNVDAIRQVQTFKNLTDDKDKLVEQLAIFALTWPNKKEFHDLFTLTILDLLQLPPSVPIRVLAPYFDADDPQLRNFAQLWFVSHDGSATASLNAPRSMPVNYEEYEEYVSRRIARGDEVPTGFIKYIYERSPGRALLVFAYASGSRDVTARLQAIQDAMEARQQGRERTPDEIRLQREKLRQEEVDQRRAKIERREILLAEHIVSNAIWLKENEFAERFQGALPEAMRELEQLAQHEAWWARLYVAEIMRQHPEFLRTATVERLVQDDNALVSEAAGSISE